MIQNYDLTLSSDKTYEIYEKIARKVLRNCKYNLAM